MLSFTTGDEDYASKVRKIILVPESVIIHKEEQFRLDKRKKFLWKVPTAPRVNIYQCWRIYYALRNLIYLGKKYQINKFIFYYSLLKSIINTIIDVIIYDDFKMKRISTILKALIDGLKGRISKNIDPGEWANQFTFTSRKKGSNYS